MVARLLLFYTIWEEVSAMRKYTLASCDTRNGVDLRDFEGIIVDAVHSVCPTAKVRVEKDCYYVSPTLTKGDAVKVGRLICKSKLSHYCIHIAKLFSSIEVKEESYVRKQQPLGGHF